MSAVAIVVAWIAVVGLVLIARADYGRRRRNPRQKQHRPGVHVPPGRFNFHLRVSCQIQTSIFSEHIK